MNATLLLLTGVFALPALSGQTASAAPTTVIRAGKLFEPESGRLLEHPVIIISGNQIEAVESGTAAIPPNSRVVDLGDATVLPGFIDVHTHLTMDAGGGGYQSLGISVPRAALIGAKNARLTLLAGFTTVRNVGAEGYADVALRDAITILDAINARDPQRARQLMYDHIFGSRDKVLQLASGSNM